jgi:hypothetical protein
MLFFLFSVSSQKLGPLNIDHKASPPITLSVLCTNPTAACLKVFLETRPPIAINNRCANSLVSDVRIQNKPCLIQPPFLIFNRRATLWVLTQINNGVHYQLFESPTAAGQINKLLSKDDSNPLRLLLSDSAVYCNRLQPPTSCEC